MPMLTESQRYASGLVRKLRCVRRDQIHWIIGRKYPQAHPEKIMRQVCHLLMIWDDGEYYRWPGVSITSTRTEAIDVMRCLSGGKLPIFDTAPEPCKLIFFLVDQTLNHLQAYRIYAPRQGEEAECRALVETEREPEGYIAVFVLESTAQIPLSRVSHPHAFAIANRQGEYEILETQ